MNNIKYGDGFSVACYVYRFEVDCISSLDDGCFAWHSIFNFTIYKKTPQGITYDYQWWLDESDFCNLLWGSNNNFEVYEVMKNHCRE